MIWKTYSAERNLSQEGREQAAIIGVVFKQYKIPVVEVLSSPCCRIKDTGGIVFGQAQSLNDLRFAIKTDKKEGRLLETVLLTPPPPLSNTIIVSHTANLKEAANLWPKPEGSAYIFLPRENQGLDYIGSIPGDQWDLMLKQN